MDDMMVGSNVLEAEHVVAEALAGLDIEVKQNISLDEHWKHFTKSGMILYTGIHCASENNNSCSLRFCASSIDPRATSILLAIYGIHLVCA